MEVFIMLLMVLIQNHYGGIKKEEMGLMGLLVRRLSIIIMRKQYINNGIFFYYIFSDIFIPAAFQKTINMDNAHKFNCKLVVEGANGPTTEAA
jgi:glutamate dehydrogenase/leucine dehydrogenase